MGGKKEEIYRDVQFFHGALQVSTWCNNVTMSSAGQIITYARDNVLPCICRFVSRITKKRSL